MAVGFRLERRSATEAPSLNRDHWRCVLALATAELERAELDGRSVSDLTPLRLICQVAAAEIGGGGDDRAYLSRRGVDLAKSDPGPTGAIDGGMPSRRPPVAPRPGKRWAFDWMDGEREVDA
jgi:hypothetical protein